MVEFSVELEKCNEITFTFYDGEMFPIDISEEEPVCISGRITACNSDVGRIRLYELYNDNDFMRKCDAVSADCTVIASAICGKNGRVLKKYMFGASGYEPIYILDELTIDEKYRGQGIGTMVIRNLCKMIEYKFGSCSPVFLCAGPYEVSKQYGFDSAEYDAAKRKLVEFYENAGCTVIKDNILVCLE